MKGAQVITDSQKYSKTFARVCAVAMLSFAMIGCDGGGGGDGSVKFIQPGPPLPAPGGTLPDIATSNKEFNDAHFAGSGICSDCHNNDQTLPIDERPMAVNTDEGIKKDVSIGLAWETSTMANSARDPYWHAVVASEIARFPNLESKINDKCTVCHAPMANTLAKKTTGGVNYKLFSSNSNGTVQEGLLDMDDTSELFNHAMDGVSCSLCHQIEDVGLGTAASMTGGYSIPTIPEETKDERPAYGQYGDPDVVYMKTVGEFTPQFGAHISTSETCATCHNLNLEPVNTMHDNKGPLGIDDDLDFLPSIQRNREFLRTSDNGVADFDVKVTNLTGHKLPSGYHSRRAYLHVVIQDANGVVVYENGKMEPDGSIAGVDEDVNPTVWEPHHTVITEATQVQVYQAITGNDDDVRTHSLLNSAYFLKDNRLTPAGFDKNNVSADVAVTGLAKDDSNFNLGSDTVKYLADLNGGQAPYDITVFFRYQPISKGHLDDLFSQSDKIPSVDHFRTMYERTPFKDEVMTFGTAVIE